MTPEEYAQSFTFDLLLDDMGRGRSQQTDARQLGMSDLGGCREYVRRFTLNHPFTDAPKRLPAMLGTWIDSSLKDARKAANPSLIVDAEVMLTLDLPGFPGLRIMGHPDEIDPDEPSVTDYKTKDNDGLAYIRRAGTQLNHRYQRHLYYAACVESGLLPAEGIVRNIYLDRSGKDPEPFVEQEPYDPAVVAEASDWLASVLYGVEHEPNEVLTRDTPEPVCRDYCPFYTACRGFDYGGELEPVQVEAARIYLEADALVKKWEPVRAGAKAVLVGASGTLDGITVRSTEVPASDSRRGYTTVTVRAA